MFFGVVCRVNCHDGEHDIANFTQSGKRWRNKKQATNIICFPFMQGSDPPTYIVSRRKKNFFRPLTENKNKKSQEKRNLGVTMKFFRTEREWKKRFEFHQKKWETWKFVFAFPYRQRQRRPSSYDLIRIFTHVKIFVKASSAMGFQGLINSLWFSEGFPILN